MPHSTITSPQTMASTRHARMRYQPLLDGVRGLAILAVIAFNSGAVHLGGRQFNPWQGGFLGVDLFFVLSGFLITTLLVREWDRTGAVNLKHFYARRALRLLPALVVMLAACALYLVWFGTEAQRLRNLRSTLLTLCYSANWLYAWKRDGSVALGHMWSLSVEEQFYIGWPLLLCVLLRRRVPRRWILLLTGAAGLASALCRLLLCHYGATGDRLYFGSDARADALLAGCFVGLLSAWDMLPRAGQAKILLRLAAQIATLFLAVMTVVAPRDAMWVLSGGLTAYAVAAAVVIAQLMAAPPRIATAVLEWPALVWIGRISYGLYLWHKPILRVSEHLCRSHPVLHLLQLIGIFGAAIASFYGIERPLLRLKERFQPTTRALERPEAPRNGLPRREWEEDQQAGPGLRDGEEAQLVRVSPSCTT